MEEILTDTADNGVIEGVQLAPIGEYVGSDAEGNPVPEKLDAESLTALADRLNAEEREVLADVDHGASKPGLDRDTKAAGWFSRFVVDPLRGLFARLRLTKRGRELVENREYRFVSPTFTLDADGRPVELHTASLTNTPAFQGFIDPVLNQAPGQDNGETEMSKEEIVELIKETVKAMNACSDEETAKAENQEPAEEPKEEVKEEVKEEIAEEKTETAEEKTEEPVEEKEEEKEVIKAEALNQAPAAFADVSRKNEWMNLHGAEFFDYLAKHPEIRG